MATSVLIACGLNMHQLPPFVHISEESNVDGSFLVSCILGQRLRISNAGTLLVCLQHHYQHYFNAGMRLGYNCNIFLGKTLNIIDPLNDIGRKGVNSKWLANTGDCLTELLLADIREQLQENFTHRVNTTVVIDNLSILFNLGASKEAVQQLCQSLSALPKEFENLTVITKMNNSDIYTYVDNNVAKLGDVRISVLKMESGLVRDIDGKLVVERIIEEGSFVCEQSRKEILYKVNDRNVRIFNPGELGVRM